MNKISPYFEAESLLENVFFPESVASLELFLVAVVRMRCFLLNGSSNDGKWKLIFSL